MPQSFKVETPKNIDSIFSLDCFKFNEMKGLFKIIFEHLTKLGLKVEEMDTAVKGIPDFKSLLQRLDKAE